MEGSIDFNAEALIFAHALKTVGDIWNQDKNSRISFKQNHNLEKSCVKMLEPTSQMPAVSKMEPEKQLASNIAVPFSCKVSRRIEGSNEDLQSPCCTSTLVATGSNNYQEIEDNARPLSYTSTSSRLSADSGCEWSIHELVNHADQLKIDSDIYSKAALLLSVTNESLNQDLKYDADQQLIKSDPHKINKFQSFCNNSRRESNSSNQAQDSFYLAKTSCNTSPMSSNSSGYCSTSQSSSFLELEDNESSSFLSTNSSHSPRGSLESESATREYSVQNPSDIDSQYFGEKFATEPASEKLKNSSHSKRSSEEYVCNKSRTANRPKTFYNSTGKPGRDVKLSQPNLAKSMYIYDENNQSADSPKWETFFSSRPKSQFQSCSSQRFTATKIQKKPVRNPVPTEDFKVEYSVDRLLSFNEGTFIDTHCHLDYLLDKIDFKETFTDYRRDFPHEFPPSYGGCVTVFCNPFSFNKTLQWKKLLSDEYIWAAFGCHPKSADHYTDFVEDSLCAALSHPKVCALGEIGLDYSDRSMCSKSKQKDVFKRQIIIGLAFNLPLVIHCRDAYDDCLEILKELVPLNHPIHLHCFTSEWSIAQKYLDVFPNLCIGFTNVITFKSSLEIQEVVRNIPLNRLLLETDAPYFIPRALTQFRVSHPGMAIFVAAKVASLKNIPLKNVLMQTRRNTEKIYKI